MARERPGAESSELSLLYAGIMLTIPPLFVIWFSDLLFVLPWVLIVVSAHYVVSGRAKAG